MFCGYSLVAYYEASPDWIKAVWVLSAPAFIAVMTGLILHYRISMRRLSRSPGLPDRAFDADQKPSAPPIGHRALGHDPG